MKVAIMALAVVLGATAAQAECASGPGSTGHWVYTRHNHEHRCWFRDDKVTEKDWVPAQRETDLKKQIADAEPVHETHTEPKLRPRHSHAAEPRHKRPAIHPIKADPLPNHAEKPLDGHHEDVLIARRLVGVVKEASALPIPMLSKAGLSDIAHEAVINRALDQAESNRARLITIGQNRLQGDGRPIPDLRPVVYAPTKALSAPAVGTDAPTKLWIGGGCLGLTGLLGALLMSLRGRRPRISWSAQEGYQFPFIGEKQNLAPPVVPLPEPRQPTPTPRPQTRLRCAPVLKIVSG